MGMVAIGETVVVEEIEGIWHRVVESVLRILFETLSCPYAVYRNQTER